MSQCKMCVCFVASGAARRVHRVISGASGYSGCVTPRRPPTPAARIQAAFDVDSSRDATIAAEGRVPSGPPADALHWETPSRAPRLQDGRLDGRQQRQGPTSPSSVVNALQTTRVFRGRAEIHDSWSQKKHEDKEGNFRKQQI